MKNINLSRIACLVTRPAPQGEIFCKKLLLANAKPHYFPTIHIEKLDIPSINFADFDWVIFTSPQAVYACMSKLNSAMQSVATIGEGTARILETECGILAIHPATDFSSEGLLALSQFAEVADKHILICQGENARPLLKTELTARGAKVNAIDVYRRTLPHYTPAQRYEIFSEAFLSVIVLTSAESLQNLHQLLQDNWKTVLKIPLIVTNQKMLALANTFGFETVFMASNASDEAVLQSLQQHLDHLKSLPLRNIKMDKPADENVVVTEKKHLPMKTIGICIVFVAFTIGFLGFYYATHTLIQLTRTLEQQVFTQESELANARTLLARQTQAVNKISQDMSQQQSVLNTLKTAQNTQEGWQISESYYLIKLANANLEFNKNVPLAIKLLQTADDEIKVLSNPKLTALREALAQDIVGLQALPKIDSEGIYVKLLAYDKLIDTLSLPNQRAQSEAIVNPALNKPLNWWQRGWQSTKLALSKIVIIRYHQSNELPFVAPDSIAFVYQNMHAMIDHAMYGLLNQNAGIYTSSLTTLNAWLTKYFIQDEASKAMIENINQLSQIQLALKIPTLQSLAAYQTFFNANDQSSHIS